MRGKGIIRFLGSTKAAGMAGFIAGLAIFGADNVSNIKQMRAEQAATSAKYTSPNSDITALNDCWPETQKVIGWAAEKQGVQPKDVVAQLRDMAFLGQPSRMASGSIGVGCYALNMLTTQALVNGTWRDVPMEVKAGLHERIKENCKKEGWIVDVPQYTDTAGCVRAFAEDINAFRDANEFDWQRQGMGH